MKTLKTINGVLSVTVSIPVSFNALVVEESDETGNYESVEYTVQDILNQNIDIDATLDNLSYYFDSDVTIEDIQFLEG